MTRARVYALVFLCAGILVCMPPLRHAYAQDWNAMVKEYSESVEKTAYEYTKKKLEEGKSEKEARKGLVSAVDSTANKEMDKIVDKTMTSEGKMPAKLANMIFQGIFRNAKEKAKAAGVSRAVREHRSKNWREIEPKTELVDKKTEDKEIAQAIRKTTLFEDFKDIAELKLTKPVIVLFFVKHARERKIWLQAEECIEMQEVLFANPRFFAATNEFIQLRVDMAKLNKLLLRKYKVRSAPTVVFFDCVGNQMYAFDKVKQNVDKLVKKMEGFVAKSEKVREKEKAKLPKEIELPEPEDGKIFNGRNLDGFEADREVFKIRKKCIYGNQAKKDAPAYLFWKRPAQGDFTFSVKLIIDKKHGSNISLGGGKVPVGVGIVIAAGETENKWCKFWTEAVHGEKGRLGLSGGRFGSSTSRDAGKNWIEMKVVVKNKFLRTFFNGEEINAESFSSYKGGKIGVFVHMCDVRFKDLTLLKKKAAAAGEPGKETPEAAAKEEKPAPREDPVAKRILEKLARISPEGYVAVPAGEFLMGTVEPRPPRDDTRPQHKVYLDAFFIKKYETTQAEYKPFVDETGTAAPGTVTRPGEPESRWKWSDGTYPPGTDKCPVVVASWNECNDYCKWLGGRMGRTCSISTEAQWEKAATWNFVKAEKYEYPWGNRPPEQGWVKEPSRGGGGSPVGSNLHDVSFCGCFDMLGNVREYCLDVYDDEYYKKSPYKNPRGPEWPPDDDDHHTLRGDRNLKLTGRTWGGSGKDWRGWHVGFRVVLEPTEKEKLLIRKIVESKGDFDVEAYLEKEKKKKLAEFEKYLFKGKVKKKKGVVGIEYSFRKPEEKNDWVFAGDIFKPNRVSSNAGMWDIVKSGRSLTGGGKVAAFAKAVFTGDATFDVQLRMKNVKNLVLMVASYDKEQASAACFAINRDNKVFASEYTKKQLAQGYINLIFRLEKGAFKQHMLSCSDKGLTFKDGKARTNGELRVVAQTTGSDILNKVSAGHLVIGGKPMGTAPGKKLKSGRKHSFKIKVIGGFVLFYMGRDFLGFTIAPQGAYRFGVAAIDSFVDLDKVELAGKLDKEWLEKEAEK